MIDPEYAATYNNAKKLFDATKYLGVGENISLPGAKGLATTTGDVITVAGSTEKAVSKAAIISNSFGSGGSSGDDSVDEGAGQSIKFGSDAKSAQKISNQMTKRGWTKSTVKNTVSSPHTTRMSTNKATGNPATVYYNKAGGYVIIDDTTKAVVQVSDNINPSTWIPDPNIINPYKP